MYKTDCFFNSIFFNQFFIFYSRNGLYYKFFIYFFLILKFFKKRYISVFYLFSKVLTDHFLSVTFKSKILFKLKKRAKKFKKKKKVKKYLNKLYNIYLTRTPKKKIYKTLRKLCTNLWIAKNKKFIILMYSSILNFFCYLKAWTSFKGWYLHLKCFMIDTWKLSLRKKKKTPSKRRKIFLRLNKKLYKKIRRRQYKKILILQLIRIWNPQFLSLKVY